MASPEKIKIEKIQELINEGGINAPEKIDKAFEEVFKWLSQYKPDLDSEYKSVFNNWKDLKNEGLLFGMEAEERSIKSSLRYFLQQIQEKKENSKALQIDWKKIIATVLGFAFMGILGWIFTDFPSFISFFTPEAKPQITYTLLFEAEENPPIEWKAIAPMIKITTDQTQEEIIVDHRVSFTAEDTLKDWVYLDLLGEPNYLIREDSIKLKPGNNRVMVYRKTTTLTKPIESPPIRSNKRKDSNISNNSTPSASLQSDSSSRQEPTEERNKPEKIIKYDFAVSCRDAERAAIDGKEVSLIGGLKGYLRFKVTPGEHSLTVWDKYGDVILESKTIDVTENCLTLRGCNGVVTLRKAPGCEV